MEIDVFETRLADVKVDCHRCNGEGRLSHYHYNKGGVCFACGGHGYKTEQREVQVWVGYNEEALKAQQERREEHNKACEAWRKANPNKEWWEELQELGVAY